MPARVPQAPGTCFFATMLLALIACAPTPTMNRVGMDGPGIRTILTVTNKKFDPQQVSLMRSGAVIPIGMVPALSTRVFLLSGSQFGDGGTLQLLAGSRSDASAFRSGTFSAMVGHRIEWVINLGVASDVVIVR